MANFYITNYNRFPNPKLFRYYMFNEYNAIKLKKERQKINSINELKTYCEIPEQLNDFFKNVFDNLNHFRFLKRVKQSNLMSFLKKWEL